MTRADYLQQRKSTVQLFRRQATAPAALFFVSIFVMSWMQRNEIRPSNSNELVLHCLILATCAISIIWAYVIGLSSDKHNVIRCTACGKNNGREKASRWLIASGNCFYCREEMFQDNSEAMKKGERKPLISRAEFEERLKVTESQLGKVTLIVSAPMTVFLIWMAFQSSNLANLEYLTAPIILLFSITVLLLVWLTSRTEKQSGAKCSSCGGLPRYYSKIVLATGGCVYCGHRMFDDQ